MPPLRLLEVGVPWPPEPFILRKLQALAEAGVEVTVASPVTRREARRRVPGLRLLRLRPAREPRIVSALWCLRDGLVLAARSPRRLVRLVRMVRPLRLLRLALPLVLAEGDAVQYEWLTVAAHQLPLFAALECPVAVSCRGSVVTILPHTGHTELTGRYPEVFERAALAHCVSEATAAESVGLGLDPAKARVIRPSVDASFFSPGDPVPADELRIVSVGRLTWVKGHTDAVQAVALLAAEGVPVSYEIVGGEPGPDSGTVSDRDQVLFLIHSLGLTGRVKVLGALPREQVRERLQASHVLLHPSIAEGFANSVLEAMACGLPVVLADAGGMREAATDGVEALFCQPRSPRALADALRRLWDDRQLAARLGAAGRARAVAEFAPDAEARAFLDFYRELTGATADESFASIHAVSAVLSPNERRGTA